MAVQLWNEMSLLKENLLNYVNIGSGPEESKEVVQYIVGELQKIETIDLHYTGHTKEQTIGDVHVRLLVAAMQEVDLSRLQVLNLSGCVLEDQVIITMLAELMWTGSLPTLRYLDLSGHYTLTNDGNAALARALRSGRLANLQHLGLPRCNIGDMVDAIQEGSIQQLRNLTFSGSDVNISRSSNIHKLFPGGNMTQIKKLIMKGQSLDSRGMVSIARALHSHSGNILQILDLSSNTLGIAGSIALARLIDDGNLVQLRLLRFSSCSIDGEQMEAIAQGIESGQLCNLEHLDVSWNKFKDQGALALSRAIEAGHLAGLRRLNVGYCEIGTQFKLRHGILAVLEALGEGRMPQLEWLNVLGNHVGQAAATTVANTIVEILDMMPALRFVNLFDNRHKNVALKEALDLVLRYPVSEFTAVYSGLKRKTNGPPYWLMNAKYSKQNSCPRLQCPKDRRVLLSSKSA